VTPSKPDLAVPGLTRLVAAPELKFPAGVPGFEKLHRWRLMEHQEAWPFLHLSSLERPAVTIVVVEPRVVFRNYAAEFSPENLASVGLTSVDDGVILAVVSLDPERPTLNLRAPLLINPETNAGAQIVLDDESWPVSHPLFPASEEA
jgi:flagellar assembly factor FliW